MAIKRFKPTSPARRYYEVARLQGAHARRRPSKQAARAPEPHAAAATTTGASPRASGAAATSSATASSTSSATRSACRPRSRRSSTIRTARARIALLHYADGEKRYILAPDGLDGRRHEVVSSRNADIKPGNALPLRFIPVGTMIHNIEMKIGKGAQLVRSAGTAAQLMAKEGDYAQVRLPSRRGAPGAPRTAAPPSARSATCDARKISLGKAGRTRWLGRRPHNRGVTMNPVDHPMGGGEGRTSGGRHPCSPWGQLAKGLKTRKNKRTDKFIVKRRSAEVIAENSMARSVKKGPFVDDHLHGEGGRRCRRPAIAS